MTTKNLTLNSVVRFTGMSQDYVARKTADSLYRHRFPSNFARELIHGIWAEKGFPDADKPRLEMGDLQGAFKCARSTIRKYITDLLPESNSKDIRGRRVFSLNEFFKLAREIGQAEWVFDGKRAK